MIDVTTDKMLEEKMKSKLPLVLDFSAPWCQPCKVLTPLLEKIEKDYAGKVDVLKIDVTTCQSAAQKFNIYSLPTVLGMKNGAVVGQSLHSETKLRELFSKLTE